MCMGYPGFGVKFNNGLGFTGGKEVKGIIGVECMNTGENDLDGEILKIWEKKVEGRRNRK